MEPRLEANRDNWNSRVKVHVESRFYDVEGWLRDTPGPPPREMEALGNLEGKSLVHLQCHFGMDTLRWAREGAIVTGLDFSPEAIDEATSLAGAVIGSYATCPYGGSPPGCTGTISATPSTTYTCLRLPLKTRRLRWGRILGVRSAERQS